MAFPTIDYASLGYNGATQFYSNEVGANSFIRLTGDFVSGQNQITNCAAVSGYFGLSEVMVGMILVSGGEISGETTITAVSGTTITVSDNAIASGTSQLMRIRPKKGMYFFESASFTKVGTGNPSDLRDVTGSEDAEYKEAFDKWGFIAPLAFTGSATSTVTGNYGQYSITKIASRIGITEMNFYATASDTIPAFIEDSGSQISAGSSVLMLSEIANNFMAIAGANDVGAGGQGLALGGYSTVVASTIATLTSASGGAGFPFTGSAQITGSIGLTGSQEIRLNATENFLIKNQLQPTQSLFNIDNEGTAVFRAREGSDGIPTAVLGGLYYTTSSVFVGINP